MAKRHRRKYRKNHTKNFLLAVAFIIGLYSYVNTQDLKLSAITTAALLGIIYIVVCYIKIIKRNTLLNSGIDIVDKMSGERFEKFLAAHFSKMGYRVKLTPITNDFGCDLVLYKDGMTTVVQAKRWRDRVGIKAVQEIIGAINYYEADNAMVVTNSYFTSSAKELSESNDVVLWDRRKLIEVMRQSNCRNEALKSNDRYYDGNSHQLDYCPICGSKLASRHGKHGYFYGCSSYPKCRFTKNI